MPQPDRRKVFLVALSLSCIFFFISAAFALISSSASWNASHVFTLRISSSSSHPWTLGFGDGSQKPPRTIVVLWTCGSGGSYWNGGWDVRERLVEVASACSVLRNICKFGVLGRTVVGLVSQAQYRVSFFYVWGVPIEVALDRVQENLLKHSVHEECCSTEDPAWSGLWVAIPVSLSSDWDVLLGPCSNSYKYNPPKRTPVYVLLPFLADPRLIVVCSHTNLMSLGWSHMCFDIFLS